MSEELKAIKTAIGIHQEAYRLGRESILKLLTFNTEFCGTAEQYRRAINLTLCEGYGDQS